MPSPSDIRSDLLNSVSFDLLGPSDGPDEIVYEQRVRDRYLVGMLAPEGTIAIDPDRDDNENPDNDLGAVEADESDDPGTGKASLFPSSLGVSFALLPDVRALDVVVEWGEYDRVDNPIPAEERPEWQSRRNRVWKRTPRSETVAMAIPALDGPIDPTTFASSISAIGGEVELSGICDTGPQGHRLITIFLRNRLRPPDQSLDRSWMFQPSLSVRVSGGLAGFCGRNEAVGPMVRAGTDQSEQTRLDLQYRYEVEFARGHGVSVTTNVPNKEDSPGRADGISTTFLPTFEVPNTVPSKASDTPQLSGLIVEMGKLADESLTVDDLQSALRPLSAGYEEWLEVLKDEVTKDAEMASHQPSALDAIDDASEVAAAISAGIDLLGSDVDALAAFRFANGAMKEQRLRTEASRLIREGDTRTLEEIITDLAADPDDRSTSWRPFQLAFILLNLPSLVDPGNPDRANNSSLVELLFFPTGGGKTEAYLGLVAFTFAIRRRRPDLGDLNGSDGVAVIMRYTLRLLTAQQFERAAALVCATELIRRSDESWGETPFRLGLWVGGSLTPNRSAEARDTILSLRDGRPVSGASPVQLSSCPWCGTEIDPSASSSGSVFQVRTHEENLETERTVTYCANEDCPFSENGSPGEGIPVVTVDDEVYRTLPSFVIGTIDKFAQIPWNSNGRMLFGHVSQRCERHGWRSNDPTVWHPGVCEAQRHHTATAEFDTARILPAERRLRPPDLVIQDEFHLITGPLGSIAGLYETVVDRLSEWEYEGNTVRPKVVASTATIRRANDQVRRVFARGTRIFPPQVVDVKDTFFARQVDTAESPGRLYVGICAQGRRLKEGESALFRTVMAAAQFQWDQNGPSADPWMTTVGYFSSIRELAGMRRIAGDELRTRLSRIERDRRNFLSTRFVKYPADPTQNPLYWEQNLVELTSRVGSGDLREALVLLSKPHEPNADGNPVGTDLVLATNMISVGVDVQRLGLMVVVGQPKTTAEYIQASSRVGRSSEGPGLVLTLHNWARPRDLSHWETFEHYHATFYRHVEAQSVTPFADRALDRALSAVLVSLMRGEVDEWTPDRAVDTVDIHAAAADEILDAIADRARRVSGLTDVVDRTERMVRGRYDDLNARQNQATAPLAWRARGEGSDRDNLVPLLEAGEAGGDWGLWTLPNSMRNIEPGINVLLRRPNLQPLPKMPPATFSRVGVASIDGGPVTTVDDEDVSQEAPSDPVMAEET